MNTYHLNETAKFWELARYCSDSLDDAIRNRKHFTDIGDLNYLMYQSMMHPNLTPSNSLRTSLLVVFRDTMLDNLTDLTDALGVDDYVGCSSIHGIGPSLAVFDSIRNGQLHCANVYPSPLHSHSQMQILCTPWWTILSNLIHRTRNPIHSCSSFLFSEYQLVLLICCAATPYHFLLKEFELMLLVFHIPQMEL